MVAHRPVLLDEVLDCLSIRPGGIYVDATFGRGGHANAILERLGPDGRLYAIDRDPEALEHGRAAWANDPRGTIEKGNFADLVGFCSAHGLSQEVHGIVMDLGVSSPQLEKPGRGFSFSRAGPLDMRMDPDSGQSAREWLAKVDERSLAKVIREYGEERFARRIAGAIVAHRGAGALDSTTTLAELISSVVPGRQPGRHPATRTFQAIRMFINRELDSLREGLDAALEVLSPGGRLCVISFHSLEDRIVKRFMRDHSRPDPVYAGLPDIPPHARPVLKLAERRARPGAVELEQNPRARSATLRVAEKLSVE